MVGNSMISSSLPDEKLSPSEGISLSGAPIWPLLRNGRFDRGVHVGQCLDANVLRVNVRQAPLFDAEMQVGPTAAVPAEIMGGGT